MPMQQLLSVFTTDSPNLYGTRFSVTSLVSTLWQEHDIGVPMLMAHDMLRTIGWSYPRTVHFAPGLSRLTGVGVLVETQEESDQLSKAINSHTVQMAAPYEKEIERLKQLLAPYVLGNEKILPGKECLALVEDGLCERAFPRLFETADKDGLVPLNQLTPIGPGVYVIGELAIFAHYFFRRSLARTNTLNSPFLGLLQNAKLDGSTAKIALDRDAVGLAETYREYQEHAYWWGPKFSDALTDIQRGVTHHEAHEHERIFHGISGTQFWWQSRDNQHIFEAEELRDIPVHINSETRYGCRYVHSIVDETTSSIFHLDGAVRRYSEEGMIARLETDIARAGRHTEYLKLWRIDGSIPINLWKSLVSDYFRDNRLVGEYLGAEPEDNEILPEPEPEEGDVVQKYVPHSMQQGDGLRIALSFHPYDNPSPEERFFVPLDVLSNGEELHSYVEAWCVELVKAISRAGGTIEMPKKTLLVSYKDSYINFPLVMHGKEDTQAHLRATVEGIRLLTTAFHNRGHDLVMSYSIGFPIQDKEARISVLGHVADLVDWLSTSLCVPPTDAMALEEWGESVADYLKRTYRENTQTPPLFETLMSTGILLIKRQRLEEKLEAKYEQAERGVGIAFIPPTDEPALIEALEREVILPAMAFVKIASRCTKCGANYTVCGCSKMMDMGVAEEITELRLLPPFWTDRAVR
jgi:hypothetical protein